MLSQVEVSFSSTDWRRRMPSDDTEALLFFAYEGSSLHEVVLNRDGRVALHIRRVTADSALQHIIDCNGN